MLDELIDLYSDFGKTVLTPFTKPRIAVRGITELSTKINQKLPMLTPFQRVLYGDRLFFNVKQRFRATVQEGTHYLSVHSIEGGSLTIDASGADEVNLAAALENYFGKTQIGYDLKNKELILIDFTPVNSHGKSIFDTPNPIQLYPPIYRVI